MEHLEGGDFKDLVMNEVKRSYIDDADLFRYID